MRLLPAATLAAALVVSLLTFGLTRGEQGKVVGSEHDLGVAAFGPGVSSCETCHLPHDASGESLWSDGLRPEGDAFSGLKPLCYSCHDGTVTADGVFAFSLGMTEHPTTPGEVSEDCDMCHDPHEPDYGSFLLFPTGANLCRACHARTYDSSHSLNVNAVEMGYVPQDDVFDPDEGDFSGTRLWDAAGSHAGSYLKCLSCHAAHGATSSDTLLSMTYRDEASTASTLCPNCHP